MNVKELFDLTGKVALVTGGSRGLGLDMATGLGEAGASLVITARREQWLKTAEAELRAKGIKVFVRVDHSGEAEKVGLKMAPTQLLIFGNPKAGTPVMLAAPTAAIDLPLKALAWQDTAGQAWLSYNDPAYLMRRFGLSEDEIKTIVPVGHLLEESLN